MRRSHEDGYETNGVKMKMDMKEPKMDHSTHAMVSQILTQIIPC
jgi:2C-methyl-D-erythritol 2,4-cyclodiphosphate synthase